MRRLTMMAGALGAALLMSMSAFAQVPPDPNNPNEAIPDQVNVVPYGEAIKLAEFKNQVDAGTIHDMMDDVARLRAKISANINDLTPSQYSAASRSRPPATRRIGPR